MVANQLEYEWLTDAVDTTGAAFLGLTFGCARCHDHKSDPITQKDYFAMQAIFAASDRPYPARIRLQRIKALNGLLSEAPVPKKLEDDPRCTLRTDDPNGMWLFHRKEPMNIHRLHRGLLSKPREELKPAFPAVLSPGAARSSDRASAASFPDVPPSKRRSELARWLTAPENPLTARVLVNRAWAWHFGQGIVRTPSDFGVNGEPPSDQGLLDWLARDFIDNGWSLKHLHRRIMLSRTYQMSSVGQASAVKADPENRLLTHFQRRRLEGEAIRDHILACTGSLNRKQFGPAVVPPLSKEELTGLFGAKEKWPVTKDVAEHTRRSVYLLVRRTFGYPMLAAFDPPEVMTSCAKRTPTIVPTQALTLLNSPVAREQSLEFARRLVKECGDDQEKRLSRAWLLAFGRPITAPETKRALAFLDHRTGGLSGRPHEKQSPISPQVAALADLCLALFNSNEFTYID